MIISEVRMEFSVLMSVYRQDNPIFFKQALDSITIEQEIKPKQVVIVYDGPVSKEIDNIINKSSQKNKRIEYTLVKIEKNKGLSSALNKGIEYCKFEWIARMDSDDIAVSNRFKKQIQCIEKNPEVSVVGGYISEFIEKPNDVLSIRKVGITNDEIIKMSKFRTPMNHVTVMYKKADILNIGKYNEEYGKLEDYKLWIDLISNGKKLININEILVNVRIGNGFIERRSNREEIVAWDKLQNYLLKKKLINIVEALRNRVYIRGFIYTPKILKKIIYRFVLRGN